MTNNDIIYIANFIMNYNLTVRSAGKTFDIPKSTLHYNLTRKCYEVHSYLQTKSSYCFTIPYYKLDERTLDYAYKTLSSNRDNLIKEIEENNARIEKKNLKKQVDAIKEIICL